jgi:hypothetical protein
MLISRSIGTLLCTTPSENDFVATRIPYFESNSLFVCFRFVHLYGPLSGFGTWAFERHNGWLSRVNHNKRESDVPTTLMRAWLADSRLTAVLNNPSPNASAYERQALQTLLVDNSAPIRGTLMVAEQEREPADLRLAKPIAKPVDLEKLGVYQAVLAYVQDVHSEYGFQDFSAGMFQDDVPLLPKR